MATTAITPTSTRRELWHELAQQLRVDSVRATAAAGSGHPTSAMSAADLIAVLAEKYLRYDFDRPEHPNNDHLIFSKGHASPLLYALYKAAGAIDDDELLSLRQFGSRLEGHPSPVLPWVDIATGSLGFGLPVGAGIALAAKTIDPRPYRVWVLAGDSEMAEGSVWEAFEHAAHWQLDNLTVIVDVNRLGQSGETMHGWHVMSYAERACSFGWAAFPAVSPPSRTNRAGTARSCPIPTPRSPSSAAGETCESASPHRRRRQHGERTSSALRCFRATRSGRTKRPAAPTGKP